MLVHICDNCHKRIEDSTVCLDAFRFVVGEEAVHGIEDKEFCNLYCMQQYVLNGLKGRGFDEHIKV